MSRRGEGLREEAAEGVGKAPGCGGGGVVVFVDVDG